MIWLTLVSFAEAKPSPTYIFFQSRVADEIGLKMRFGKGSDAEVACKSQKRGIDAEIT